ncbi:MAG: dihydroorotase family protein [Actinobacteria bacterium]|nr:dihydroorotase family protein [Actinomycetota bacterium]
MSQPSFDLAVRGGIVVSPPARAPLNLYVRDGKIADISAATYPAAEVVTAGGLLVLPGMVDTHVHLMDPGEPEREDFPAGSAAAAIRGVTTIVEHTHSHPVRTVDELAAKRAYLSGRSHVDYGLAAHVWPEHVAGLGGLWAAGASFFKVFTCTTHGVPGLDSAQLMEAFAVIAEAGAAALVHCEDAALVAASEARLRAAARNDGGVLAAWRSREAELLAVSVVCLAARLTGARVTGAHASCPAVVGAVRDARAAGADVAAEACPQYFLLREQEALPGGTLRKFTPPARARHEADETAMWELLRNGGFHHVSTDHAPSTRQQKAAGDIWSAPFGLPGLDSTAPLLLDAALRGRISLEDMAAVYAERPARRYGLRGKGRLAAGADADFTLVDPAARWTLEDGNVISKAGWTPYAGRALLGKAVRTYLRGRLIAADGEVAGPLQGRFLPGAGHRRPSDD